MSSLHIIQISQFWLNSGKSLQPLPDRDNLKPILHGSGFGSYVAETHGGFCMQVMKEMILGATFWGAPQ